MLFSPFKEDEDGGKGKGPTYDDTLKLPLFLVTTDEQCYLTVLSSQHKVLTLVSDCNQTFSLIPSPLYQITSQSASRERERGREDGGQTIAAEWLARAAAVPVQ